jgi:hypothetical protein
MAGKQNDEVGHVTYRGFFLATTENRERVCHDCREHVGCGYYRPEDDLWLCPSCLNARPESDVAAAAGGGE